MLIFNRALHSSLLHPNYPSCPTTTAKRAPNHPQKNQTGARCVPNLSPREALSSRLVALAPSRSTADRSRSTPRSALGSATRIERRGGELVAFAHEIKPSGYKCANAFGARPAFDAQTTSRYFQQKVLGATAATRGAKALMPYAPDAARNRPKHTLTNVIGRRFGPSSETSARESYRGASSIVFGDRSRCEPWTTTNQAMRARASIVATTGLLTNPGIASAIASRVHAAQRR